MKELARLLYLALLSSGGSRAIRENDPSLAAGHRQRATSQNPCLQCISASDPECSLRVLLQVGRILGLLVHEVKKQGYLPNARFAKDGGTVVYGAQWESEPFAIYTVRPEFPQSTKVDVPSAILFAVAPSGEMEIGVAPVHHVNFLSGTMSQALMAGGAPREQTNDVIAADYAPDGKTLAVVRSANQKVQLEYPAGKVLYATSGYLEYVRVSPDGKTVAFAEHPVYDDESRLGSRSRRTG
jgi:hypothetical protein